MARKPAQPDQGKPDEAAVEAEAAEAKQAQGEEQAAEQAEEPKRPRRRRRKKDEPAEAPAAAAEEETDDAKAEDAEPEEPEPQAGDDEPAEAGEEKPRRRRGAAEVSAGRKREAVPPPRSADGAVAVRARARYVRTAPRKARLVIDHIRGKPVDQARAILASTPRAASRDVLKLLDSAIANAENNHELVADELVVGQAVVDEGPTLKRYRPRALGRATRIRKRTSHMTITLTTRDRNGR
jgi:large subunit ribosomal protein L22